ncbi:MAG: histidinol-phosphatase, partial [Chloroflexota bacterium]|nr:histidinol-phosphatase [Chloroflexota bacterium]
MSQNSTEPISKQQVAAMLDEIAQLLELDGANPFEVRAYQNGSRAIGGLEGDISEVVASGGLVGVPGLGKTLIARITELVTTGHMRVYDDLTERIAPGMRQMLRIPGLGAKR